MVDEVHRIFQETKKNKLADLYVLQPFHVLFNLFFCILFSLFLIFFECWRV